MTESLPLLRISSGFLGTRIIALYGTHILIGRRPTRNLGVTEEMCTADGEPALRRNLRRLRSIELGAITHVREEFSTPHKWLTRSSQIGNSRFTLLSKHHRPVRFTIQHQQVESFRRALKCLISDRYWIRTPWQSEGCGLAVALAIGAFLLPFLALSLYSAVSERSLLAAGSALLLVLFSVGLILLLTRRGPWIPLDNFPAGRLIPQPNQRRPTRARSPVYSPSLGWTLKILGVAYWIVIASPLTDNFGHNQQLWTLVWLPAPWLIWTGYRLCQRPYRPLNPKDSRKSILFLRPFVDDDAATLQPPGLLAGITGVRSQMNTNTGLVSKLQLGQTSAQDLMYSLHPVRLLRMIFNYGVGSSEESIARFFEVYGPVVAIGRPGERLATPGSERLYISDDQWQETVRSEMIKSQALVIQPGTSMGIQWEFEQIRTLVEPFRVLLCLVVFWRNPEPYETLRKFAREHLAVEMPRVVPFLDRPAFVYFDREWVPRLQELSYRCPTLWPLTADAADLRYSLQPFIEGMFGGDREPPRPPRWNRGIGTLAANIGAVILAATMIFGPLWIVHSATESFIDPIMREPDNIIPESLQIPDLVRRSDKTTLNGRSVGYKIDVPESLVKANPESEIVEHWRKTPDSRLSLQVVAHADQEDISPIAQQRLHMNSGKDILESKLESVRTVQQAGVDWTEVRIVVTLKNGMRAREISRITSDSTHGTVLLICILVEFSESDPIYGPIMDDMLQSFRFVGASTRQPATE